MAVDFNTKGLVDVTVANHPSFVNAASFTELKGPILFNCAEEDDLFPVKLVEQVRAMLDNNDKAPKHEFKVYQGTAHSFSIRPNLADEPVKKGFEEVREARQMMHFELDKLILPLFFPSLRQLHELLIGSKHNCDSIRFDLIRQLSFLFTYDPSATFWFVSLPKPSIYCFYFRGRAASD